MTSIMDKVRKAGATALKGFVLSHRSGAVLLSHGKTHEVRHEGRTIAHTTSRGEAIDALHRHVSKGRS